MNAPTLQCEVISPPRSLARPTCAALLCCALLLSVTQRCAGAVASRLDEVVKLGGTMGPAPAREVRP